jgi:hypothetical protein|tara:strand:- start:246 stop:509 length:264 start_codon:yes stop_codon:yes gene_type:complete
MLSEPENIPNGNGDNDDYERELAEQELVKVITKLEKKITNKQNLFVGAMCTLMDACYFHAPTESSATHLILTAHQRVLEVRKEESDD